MHSTRAAAKPNHIGIDLGAEGGFVVHHSYDNRGAGDSWRPDDKHVFTDHKAMLAHVQKHTSHGGGKAPAASTQTGTGAAKAAPPGPKTRGAGAD